MPGAGTGAIQSPPANKVPGARDGLWCRVLQRIKCRVPVLGASAGSSQILKFGAGTSGYASNFQKLWDQALTPNVETRIFVAEVTQPFWCL